jgi:hypothetical protein
MEHVEDLIIRWCLEHPDQVIKDNDETVYRYNWNEGKLQCANPDNEWSEVNPEMKIAFSRMICNLIDLFSSEDLPF